jgi:hypothetical protein
MTPYMTIKAEATRQALPKHYRTDLTKHDRSQLSKKDAPPQFVWVLRESGTHLIGKWRDDDNKRREFARIYLEGVKQSNPKSLFYIFRNGQLFKTTYDNCQEFLASKGN